MSLLEKLKINLDYILGKADPSLYAKSYAGQNLTLKDWQLRWEKFSFDDCDGFVWYGVDAAGNLAKFAAQEIFVPEAYFQSVENNKKLKAFFDGLPEITASKLPENLRYELKLAATKKPQSEKSFWMTGANRGLFIFDETNIDQFEYANQARSYELVLMPEKPLKIFDLPNDIQKMLESYRFENLNFADCQFLDVSKHFYCEK